MGAWATDTKPMEDRFRFVAEADRPLRRLFSALFGVVAGEPDEAGHEALDLLLRSEHPTPDALRELGELARQASTMPEPVFVGFVATLVGRRAWRSPALRITAHDTGTGERVVLAAGGRVGLGRACAASSSVPGFFPPVAAAGRRLMDGGCGSGTNADLASGADRALVLALLPRKDASPAPAMVEELASLESGGTRVHAAWPDADAVSATGGDALDPAVAPALARAGQAHGRRDAPLVAALWS